VLGLDEFADQSDGGGGAGVAGAGGGSGATGGATGGAGAVGGEGAGGESPCVPQSIMDCYDGPPGTDGRGACLAGTQTCNDQGTGFGACVGQVLPQPESCAEPGDEDCNGTPVDICSGPVEWTLPTDPSTIAFYEDAVVTDDGAAFLVGTFAGQLDFGGSASPISAHDSVFDIFLLKVNAGGVPVFASKLGDVASYQHGNAIAATSDGSIVLAGRFLGTLSFGNGAVVTATGEDLYVARLDPNGVAQWAQRIDLGTYAWDVDVAVGPNDDVYVLGDFGGSAAIGPFVEGAVGDNDILVAKLAPNGMPLWLETFGGAGLEQAHSIAVGDDDSPVIGGWFSGSITFGGSAFSSVGGTDTFIAKLDASGAHVASTAFGATGNDGAIHLAVAADNRVFGALGMTGTTTIQGNDVTIAPANATQLALLRFSETLGYEAHHTYGASGDQVPSALAIDPAGHLLVNGSFTGTLNLGTTWVANATDTFHAKFDFLDSMPAVLYAISFARPLNQTGRAAAADPNGGAVFTSSFEDSIAYESGAVIDSGGGSDIIAGKRGL
jgi:hypothetical protein